MKPIGYRRKFTFLGLFTILNVRNKNSGVQIFSGKNAFLKNILIEYLEFLYFIPHKEKCKLK